MGNTLHVSRTEIDRPVHPHACGEHCRLGAGGRVVLGSSPRMWGTREIDPGDRIVERFIPTHVGNTSSRTRLFQQVSVHPHACGEHLSGDYLVQSISGSSPRMWGTLEQKLLKEFRSRFIPTHVGNTGFLNCTTSRSPVHPHACGEHIKISVTDATAAGSSPRMWGTRSPRRSSSSTLRFIPTHVGNT